jgi:gliding-associated putative ABC transporter substrate-binding component GldG
MATNNTTTSKKRKQQQTQAIARVIFMAGILVCVNMLAAYFHYGLDLTQEKRFTLSKPTKKLLHNMKEVAVIDVYLQGKFPAGFQRLKESTREQLQYFKEYAGGSIVYHFTDPFEGKNEQEKEQLRQQLAQKGVVGVNLKVKGGDEGYSQQVIYPFAMVKYMGKEKAVPLLENHAEMTPYENLNLSESLLEYKLASAINELAQAKRPSIAYLVGNGEPMNVNKLDLFRTVSENYNLDTFDLAKYYVPIAYDAIIISNPTLPFSDKDKYKLDQYVMHGGHILWAINNLYTPMDSLARTGQFITMDYGLNLDDILFKYGARINNDLVEDYECVDMPLVTNGSGANAQMEYYKFIYFPVLMPGGGHPIVNNMGGILSKFPNSIDTVANPSIKKTILLTSSKYSRVAASPVRVSLGMIRYPVQPEMFNKPYQPVAVLMEGKFHSVFQNRLAPSFKALLSEDIKQPYKEVCDTDNSMIVVADGNIFSNDYSASNGPMEMGFYKYSNGIFANKSFLLNCLEYLTDHSGLIEARSKTVTLRLLDASRVKKEKTRWQIINIGLPIVLVLIFASAYLFFRKRRYEAAA